jgi:hypothetical protein
VSDELGQLSLNSGMRNPKWTFISATRRQAIVSGAQNGCGH